jgi:hypothetical protein
MSGQQTGTTLQSLRTMILRLRNSLGSLATAVVTGTPDGTKFLRDDFSWETVNAVTDLGYTAGTRTITSSTGADTVLPLMSSTDAGLVPASGGGTANFLRADGTFAAPPGGGGGLSEAQVQARAFLRC